MQGASTYTSRWHKRCQCPFTVQVQDDIVGSLHMDQPLRLISSFNRPNIRYEVVYQMDDSPPLAKQLAKLIQGMCGADGATPCCIVYTLKRETADEYAQKLRMQGETPFLVLDCISGYSTNQEISNGSAAFHPCTVPL